MDNSMFKGNSEGDTTMEQAHQTYKLLSEEARRWQDERGSYWMEELSSVETPPYYPLVDFPEGVIFELWKRLNRIINVVVSESDLNDIWNAFKNGLPVSVPELFSSLQITVNAIAHLSRRKIMGTEQGLITLQLAESEEGERTRCPICGEVAAFSVLTSPNGKRCLHCALCGHEWPTTRVGCIRCGSDEASKQNYLNTDEFPGIEVVACEACGQYFKELDLRILSVDDFIWEDVRTLPLNYAAEQWLGEHAKKSGKVQ